MAPWGLSQRDFRTAMCCFLIAFIGTFSLIIVTINIDIIEKMYDANHSQVSALSQVIALSYIAFFMIAIVVADKYGKLTSLIAGLIILSVTSVLCAFAPNIILMTLFRAIMGLGLTLMSTTCLSILTDLFDKKYLGEAMAVNFAITSFAAFSSPIICRAVAEWVGMPVLFILSVPFALLAIYFLRGADNVRTKPDSKIDWPTNAAYISGMILIAIVIMVPGYSHRMLLCIIALVLLAAFVVMYIRSGMTTFSLFRNKVFVISLSLAFLMLFSSRAVEDAFTQSMELSPESVTIMGFVITLSVFATFLTSLKPLLQTIISPIIGKYYRDRDKKNISLITFVLLLISSVATIMIVYIPSPGYKLLLATAVFAMHAFCSSLFTPYNKKQMMASVLPEERNAASSLSTVVSTVATIVGVIVLVYTVDDCTTLASFMEASTGLFITVIVATAIGLFLAIRRRRDCD